MAFAILASLIPEEALPMKVVFEFYRTRFVDDAHAVIGRETAEASDIEHAMRLAQHLWRTLDMPQQPDAMSISDIDGNTIYSGAFGAAGTN